MDNRQSRFDRNDDSAQDEVRGARQRKLRQTYAEQQENSLEQEPQQMANNQQDVQSPLLAEPKPAGQRLQLKD